MNTKLGSATTRLFRVEDHIGVGPYQNRKGSVVDDEPTPHHHPMLYEELDAAVECTGVGENGSVCRPRYAFDSLDQLYRWFDTAERVQLRAHGFKIAVYEVPDDAWRGDAYQAKFHYCDSSRVEEIEIEIRLEGRE